MIYKLQNGKIIKRQIKNTALEKQEKGYVEEEGGSGFNAGLTLLKVAKNKYLSDYARSGYMFAYPNSRLGLLQYSLSPYIKTDKKSNERLEKEDPDVIRARRALFAKNFGIDSTGEDYENAIVESKYHPSISSDSDARYYTLPIDDPETRFKTLLESIAGKVKLDFGEDENGKYLSIYDIWDLAPISGNGSDFKNATPPEIYDRFYEFEIPETYKWYDMVGLDHGKSGPRSLPDDYSSGGKIHIKPENHSKLFEEGNPNGIDLHKNGGIIKLQNAGSLPKWMQKLNSWANKNIPEVSGGTIQPSVKIEKLPKKFNGSQQAARTYAEGYQKGAKPVTKAIDNAGKKIFNTTKNVAMFVPGPTGAITWLGQMGADTANGKYSKVAKDLGAAVLVGAGLKGAQAGAKAVGRTLAGKGVNIPWLDAYDYSALRGQYLDRTTNKVTRSLDKSPIKHIPIYHGTNYLGDDLRWFSGDDAGLHVGTTSSPALSFIKRPSYVIREGFVEVNPKEVVKINEDLGGWNRTSFDTQRGRETLPEKINEIVKNSDPLDYTRGTDKELRRFKDTFDINPATTQADPEGLYVVSNYKRNYTFANELSNNGIKVIDYPNEFEGAFGNRSLMITDPKRYVFAKHRLYEPKPISAQEAATTYHFDGKTPLSKPISEFERNGKYTLDELYQMGFKLPRKHLQGEDAVQMFKGYGTQYPETTRLQDSPLMQQLREYVPEARERYGLVGNTNITDDEIAGSLYKKALELGGDTAAVNEFEEPLVLFRGDTKRYNTLRKVVSPEELKSGRGSMDNSFGNLFLGQLDGPGEGVERYIHYVHQYPSGATDVYPSATGERLIWNGNKIREQGAPIFIPEKYLTYDLGKPFKRYGEQVRVRKISSELANPNSNDINAFVVRTPAVRNSSSEISPEMGGEFINIDGVPKFKNANYVDREQAALRIRQILDNAKLKNQGLLKSDAYSPLRENEHFEYDYYALPNFNIRGAKHILPFDLRMPTQWNSRIIYRKRGGIVKGQNGFLNTWQKAYNSKFGKGLRDFMFGKDRDLSDEEYLEKYGYNKPVGGIGVLGALVAPEWEGLEIPEIAAQHIGNQGKVLRWFESGNSKMLKVPIKEASKKASNWQKFLKLSQQEQDDFVRRWNGESFQGFATLKGDKQALGKFRSWINSRK